MSELQIEVVDPFDEPAVTTWTETAAAVERHELGRHACFYTPPEMIAALQADRKHKKVVLLTGSLGGQVVATGSVELPLLDNVHAADVAVSVLPEHRRRGLGSAMLERVEQVCADEDRTRFDALTGWPYDGPSDGAGTSGVEFAKAHGYSFGLGDVQRELPLPVDEALLEELAAEAAPYHRDYELRTWAGPVPDELIQGWQDLSSTLIVEAPTGDNEYEPETADVEAARLFEAVLEKQRRVKWNTAALDADGRVVAYTDLIVPGHDPDWVFQWGTLVHRDHRGHRLGLAVKAANLLGLLRSGTDLSGRRLVTWNAEVNDHMIGINERMGFRPTARGGELQKKIG